NLDTFRQRDWIFSYSRHGSPLRDVADDFAAHATSPCSTISHDATRRGDNRDTQTVQDLRKLLAAFVHTQTGTAHTLDAFDDRTAGIIFERDIELGLATVFTDGIAFN